MSIKRIIVSGGMGLLVSPFILIGMLFSIVAGSFMYGVSLLGDITDTIDDWVDQ